MHSPLGALLLLARWRLMPWTTWTNKPVYSELLPSWAYFSQIALANALVLPAEC